MTAEGDAGHPPAGVVGGRQGDEHHDFSHSVLLHQEQDREAGQEGQVGGGEDRGGRGAGARAADLVVGLGAGDVVAGLLQDGADLRLGLVHEAPQDAGADSGDIGPEGRLRSHLPGAHGDSQGPQPQRRQGQADALAGEGRRQLPQRTAHGQDDDAHEDDLVEGQGPQDHGDEHDRHPDGGGQVASRPPGGGQGVVVARGARVQQRRHGAHRG